MLATKRLHRMLQREMSLLNRFTSSSATRHNIYLGTSSPRAVLALSQSPEAPSGSYSEEELDPPTYSLILK